MVQLSHPNVVALIDVGRDRDGALFLVMELVEGGTMRAWFERWPGAAAVFRAFDEILDALSAAHAQGIVHGDLKPANVLLTAASRVKITDFGIARVIDPVNKGGEQIVSGTPFYMAPEQLFEPDDVGPPADLFAVGVMLRQLLGEGSSQAALTTPELIATKLSRPSRFELRRDLVAPPELGELITNLTEPDARRRARFAAQVRRALADVAQRVTDRDDATSSSYASAHPTLRDETDATATPAGGRLSDAAFAAGAPEVLVQRLRPVPLVARQREMELLHALEREVVEGGGPRALVLVGRTGDGKSRIARHGFAGVEREGMMVGAAASFDELGQSAKVDLRACLRRLLGTPTVTSTPETTMASRWAWLGESLDVESARGLHRMLAPDAPQLDADEAAELGVKALTAASSVRPIYLWLDDVAWSRDGALPLVPRLLGTRARVLVVTTMRSGTAEHPRARAWLEQISAHPRATVHTLAPFSNRERARLLRTMGPLERSQADELAPLLDQSTLVVVEAVRDWIDAGMLVRDGGNVYVKRAGVSAAMLASWASGALGRRMDALLSSFGDAADRAVRTLIHAALLGVHFEDRALRDMCGDAIDDVLDRTLLVGVLRVHDAGVYRFEHQLFAQVLLDRLAARSDAAEIRSVTARAIVSTYGASTPTMTMVAAQLFREAGDSRSAYETAVAASSVLSGTNAFMKADEVIAVLERWARADARDENAAAHGYVHHARGNRFHAAHDYARALECLRRARSIFADAGQDATAAQVATRIASTHVFCDQLWQAEAILEDVTASATTPQIAGRLHHHMAELRQLRGDLDGALLSERLAADVMRNVGIDHTLAALLFLHGDVAEAETARARVVAWCATSSLATAPDHVTSLETLSLCLGGRFVDALPHARAWLASTYERDNRWQMSSARAFVAVCLAATADANEAADATRAAIAAYRARHHDELQTWWALRATESWLRGRGMEALADELGTTLDERHRAIAVAFTRPRRASH